MYNCYAINFYTLTEILNTRIYLLQAACFSSVDPIPEI